MKLSVIIVNYNVKYFLEQCLYSVRKAGKNVSTEVIVVDNNSVDGSVKMMENKFPEVRLIANKENLGFSRANNQGIKVSKGEYVLLLNPDTIVEEDTFSKVVQFMDEHPDAGGLGVKMVDGKGRFLPESKRGLPTPDVAFYKIFGLSKLFPKSKTFGKYHLGFLDKDETNEVEILAGAFMLLRKSVLEEIGVLDENFFMYGEDIDLSYRIIQAGYKNYYYPGTRIIHYKGESTKKSSVNYVITFYNAMIIFARKHFSRKNARLFTYFINVAVYLRAFVAILHRFLRSVILPLWDAFLIFGGIYLLENYWEKHILNAGSDYYPIEFITIVVPIYILVWLGSVYFLGGYDRPVRLSKIFQGLVAGTVVILVFYALLPEHLRFSRAIIVMGAVWALVAMMFTRVMLHFSRIADFQLGMDRKMRIAIVGEPEEAERVANLLRKTYENPGFIGLVSVSPNGNTHEGFIGNLGQINDIISIYKIDEVIFCARDLPADQIIDKMSELQHSNIEYKIAPPESLSIIGSNSISTSGELYVVDINSVGRIQNRRNKRLIDILTSLILLVSLPVSVFIVKRPWGLIKNIFKVLFARRSWTGYYELSTDETDRLPDIKPGVLTPLDVFGEKEITRQTIHNLNLLYARDYKVKNDVNIIMKGFRNLGRG
ncbi:MAG: glycosyltransferase family 2 protein [Bacteroidales bacterium]|nr:glycosyltransferase family 2 protein [Bacteroidales bacterium]